jgi:hypothetical protein
MPFRPGRLSIFFNKCLFARGDWVYFLKNAFSAGSPGYFVNFYLHGITLKGKKIGSM